MSVGKLFRKIQAAGIALLVLSPAVFLFQNCGQVNLAHLPSEEVPGPAVNSSNVSYLKIDQSNLNIFRAAFVIDMSDSMYSGPCPDSVDTMIGDVPASENCIGPTGADPDGHRLRVLLQWINDLQSRVQSGALQADQVKLMLVPFSGGSSQGIWPLSSYEAFSVRSAATKLGIALGSGFNSLDIAKKHLFIIWALEAKKHDAPYAPEIPTDIRTVVDSIANSMNTRASTGTSIVAPAIEKMNLAINAELTNLKTANPDQIKQTHFEIVYFSDGVPKPHAKHIEAMVKLIWAKKANVCDHTIWAAAGVNDCYYSAASENGWVNVSGGKRCIDRCSDYLKIYTDTGAMPPLPPSESPVPVTFYSIPYTPMYYSDGSTTGERWSSKIMCGPCFEMVQQFNYSNSTNSYESLWNSGDRLKKLINLKWGDWTLNRHANIIQNLKATQNMFKIVFPGARFKMSFVRVDSDVPKYQTSPTELDKEINWIERAKDYFSKTQRFVVLRSDAPPFDLFSELGAKQSYRLGIFYAYNRTKFIDDQRKDGQCLDSIKKKYGACISVGCSFSSDADGDGLNDCEEVTVGTDPMEPDSEKDGVLDGAELFFGLNPNVNDQVLYTNTDGKSNFEHFIKGYAPTVNLNKLPASKMISITKNLIGYKTVQDSRGLEIEVPGYEIGIKNLPLKDKAKNEIVVVARVDNTANPDDVIWLSKVYTVEAGAKGLVVKLEELTPLRLEKP